MKKYCTQNNGECDTCSLSSYGRDCRNNPINPKKHVAFRLSEETLHQLAQLAATAGTDKTNMLETLIDREYRILEDEKMDDRMKLLYDGKIIGRITTNRSLTLEECFELLNIDINEEDGGDPVWDYGLFKMEY